MWWESRNCPEFFALEVQLTCRMTGWGRWSGFEGRVGNRVLRFTKREIYAHGGPILEQIWAVNNGLGMGGGRKG